MARALVVCLVGAEACVASVEVRLADAAWEIRIVPDTLSTTAAPAGKDTIELSAAQTGLGAVTDLMETAG